MMLKDEKTKRPMTPMLEGLLTNNDVIPPEQPYTEPPQTWKEAEKQLDDLMERRAVAMDVLSKL
jgi:hypothetical protein